jgi:hypothetical protein
MQKGDSVELTVVSRGLLLSFSEIPSDKKNFCIAEVREKDGLTELRLDGVQGWFSSSAFKQEVRSKDRVVLARVKKVRFEGGRLIVKFYGGFQYEGPEPHSVPDMFNVYQHLDLTLLYIQENRVLGFDKVLKTYNPETHRGWPLKLGATIGNNSITVPRCAIEDASYTLEPVFSQPL